MAGTSSSIVKSTMKNISRNRSLSVATVIVSMIVLTTASVFIIASILASQAVSVFQKKAQVQIFFTLETPEEEILTLKGELEQLPGTDRVRYIDKKEALKLYREYYSDDPDLLESVSEEWLPASLEVRAKSIVELEGITELVKEEQNSNPYIDTVQYYEDIVARLKEVSKVINVGAVLVIGIFTFITISLIVVTISFNIMSHKNEIEIMQLVGSSDSQIKTPFILEGTMYTLIGSLFAASVIMVPWILISLYNRDTDLYFVARSVLKELSLGAVVNLDPLFITAFFGIHIVVGMLLGFLSSYFTVAKYLNLKEK